MSGETVRGLRELLEPGVEVNIENCFPEKVGEEETRGELGSLVYKPSSGVYRVELKSGRVYTVTSDPESFGYNKYVAEPGGVSLVVD